MKPEAMNLTLELAREVTALAQAPLADADTEQVRRLMLDHVGVVQFGATMPWTRALQQWASEFKGVGHAPVIGAGFGVPAQVAALVNGSSGHGYELDDTHNDSMSHPGSVVIAAVLAAAAGSNVGARQVFSAIAAGYETMGRIGMAANGARVIARGYHPTALLGVFGAAAGVALLRGFDAETLSCAWGHGLSLTGGSMQFSAEPAGTTVKRLHAGYAAQNGVLAASMAGAGIAAPSRSIDGQYGVMALYGGDARPECLLRSTDRPLQIHRISLKPYSCCRLFHSMIDALGEATDGFGIEAGRVRNVRVRGPDAMFEHHMLHRPRSVMAAQYSLPYVVGATLAYGPHRFDAFQDRYFDDASILRLADGVEVAVDQELQAIYPARMGASVQLLLDDGSIREAQVLDSRGTPERPMSTDDIERKADALVRSAGLSFDVEAARKAIWTAQDARALVDLMAI